MKKMKTRSCFARPLAVAVLALSAGCSPYMHSVENTGNRMLYAVTGQSGEIEYSHGYLAPGMDKEYAGSLRIPSDRNPVVSWALEEFGEETARTVQVKERARRGRCVIFRIDGTNVQVLTRAGVNGSVRDVRP